MPSRSECFGSYITQKDVQFKIHIRRSKNSEPRYDTVASHIFKTIENFIYSSWLFIQYTHICLFDGLPLRAEWIERTRLGRAY